MKLTETNLIKLIDEIKLTIEPNADKMVNAIAKSFLELLNEKRARISESLKNKST